MTTFHNDILGQQMQQAWLNAPESGASASLLLDVSFKKLMAGQGWWVDTARFHLEPAYAAKCLASALGSASCALRGCAVRLRHGRRAAILQS